MAEPEKVLGTSMTDKEKLKLLEQIENWCWGELTKAADAHEIRDLLYSIEITKEMRIDYAGDNGDD